MTRGRPAPVPSRSEPDDVAVARRLGLQAGSVVLACLLAVGTVLVAVYLHQTSRATDTTLADAVAAADPRAVPAGVHVVVAGPEGERSSAGMPSTLPVRADLEAVVRDGRPRQRTVDADGEGASFVVRTARVDGRVVQAALDRGRSEDDRERFLTAVAVAAAVGVGAAVLGSAFLARRAVRPLTRTVELQRRFVADAGHELRTPLTLLSTRAQLLARRLRRRAADPDVVTEAEAVVADAAALAAVLDDLLLASSAGGPGLGEEVDLVAVVTDSVAAARPHAAQAGRTLDVVAPSDGVRVAGSPAALRRAVTALVDNAVDHARTTVSVSVTVTGREVTVAVEDDGHGIPEEALPRLFERFRSDRSAEPGSGGRRHYGLGLALVADIAGAHGGSVTAGGRVDGRPGARAPGSRSRCRATTSASRPPAGRRGRLDRCAGRQHAQHLVAHAHDGQRHGVPRPATTAPTTQPARVTEATTAVVTAPRRGCRMQGMRRATSTSRTRRKSTPRKAPTKPRLPLAVGVCVETSTTTRAPPKARPREATTSATLSANRSVWWASGSRGARSAVRCLEGGCSPPHPRRRSAPGRAPRGRAPPGRAPPGRASSGSASCPTPARAPARRQRKAG
ncbi:MAG TPA: ATP-binding protein [Dermatophilaceae bacterium]|nr:ATP-binding protein [Dermatophilaceae bacterium]